MEYGMTYIYEDYCLNSTKQLINETHKEDNEYEYEWEDDQERDKKMKM